MEKVKSWEIRKHHHHHLGPKLHDFVGASIGSTLQVGRFRLQWWLAYSSGRRIDHCVLTPMKRMRKNGFALILLFFSRGSEIVFRLWGQFLVHFDHFLDFKLKSGPKTTTKNGSLRICLIRIARKLVYSHGLRHGMFRWKKNASKVSKCCGKSLFLLTCFDCGYQFLWVKRVRIFCFLLMLGERKLDHSHLLPFGKANVFLFLPYVPTAVLLAGDSFFFGQLDGFCSVRFEFSIWTFQHQPTHKPISCCNLAQNLWSPKMDLKMTPDFELFEVGTPLRTSPPPWCRTYDNT